MGPGNLLVKVHDLDLALHAYEVSVDHERFVPSWLEHRLDVFRYLPVRKLHEREAGFGNRTIEDMTASVGGAEKDDQLGGLKDAGV